MPYSAPELIDRLYVLVGQPFHDIPAITVFGIAAIYFTAFIARGALGFGALAPTVIVTSLLINPHHAVLLAVVAATLPQLQMLPEGVRSGDWQIARPVMAATAIAIPLGVWVFANMSSDWFTLVLGTVIATLILLDMTKALERMLAGINLRSPAVAFGLSSVTGFLNGLSGAGGMVTLVVYLKHACRNHISLRASLVLIGTLMLFWRLIVTVAAGLVTLKLCAEAALLLPLVYAGVWIGTRYFRTVTPARYQRLLQYLILLSAIGLLVDGVTRLI